MTDKLIAQARRVVENDPQRLQPSSGLLAALAAALEAAEAQLALHVNALAVQDAETMRERDARRAAEAQRDTLAAALERVKQMQPQTLERLRKQGAVFDEAPLCDPLSWQGIAFWIYTDLCEVETIARVALAAVETTEERGRRLALDEGVFE